jgi:peptidoglycan/LPS O-acetylase OafA/YrhL
VSDVNRLHSLDAARGLAALAIVVWHWQHIYMIGGGKLATTDIQPFYAVLFPLYDHGWLAVEFFFTLSGFIFFWLYGQRIADKSLTPRAFWVARFSRLYPLHFIALLLVAGMQLNLLANGHESFVYDGTTPFNFVMNMLFLQHFLPFFTFNGPEWSVGVEIILYVLFFFYCTIFKPHWWLPLLAYTALGIWVVSSQSTLGRGIVGFFAGGLAYEAWRTLRDRPTADRYASALAVFAGLAWAYCVFESKTHALTYWLDGLEYTGQWWVEMAFRVGLVPLTVLALALNESRGIRFWRKLSPLGDLTYAIYLLHFPLQLVMALAVLRFGMPLAPLQSPLAMVIFMVVLIGISIASYRWVERPAQTWLRHRLVRVKEPEQAVTVVG